MSEVERGLFMGHVACPIHGGSDSLALYDKGDKIDGYCWSQCGGFSTKRLIDLEILDESGKKVIVDFATNGSKGVFVMTDEIMKEVNDVLDKPILGWRERNIPKLVSEFYDVRTVNEDGKVKYRYYPSTIDGGKLVGWHVRNDFVKQARNRGEKPAQAPFFPIGKVRSDCELFGQSKFNKGGKYLVLASGEEDAQAIFTALNVERSGSGLELKKFITPVISTTVGEGAVAQIKENYDFITSFENVIIMYDNDDAGREGAEKVAKVLKPGQAFISSYRRKDACEHASRSEFSEIVDSFWKAAKGEPYSPAGIVGSSQSFEALLERAKFEKIPMPSFASDLGEMLNGGIALGEITTIAAACVDSETEFLTKNGWVKIKDYSDSEIAIVDENLKLTFENPTHYVDEKCELMYHFKTRHGIDQMVSPNHRMPYISVTNKFEIKKASEIVENHEKNKKGFRGKFIQVFNTNGGTGLDFTEGELRLQIAVNADGRIVKEGKDNYTQMRFIKKRKYDRLIGICKKFSLKYSDRGINNQGQYEVIVWPKSSEKRFKGWYSANLEQLQIIADEVLHWDGCLTNGRKTFFGKNKEDVDFIQYVFSSQGYRSSVRHGTHVWECHVSPVKIGEEPRGVGMGMTSGCKGKVKIEKVSPDNGRQYCFTTSTGMWLARRNGNIFVTGNSSVGKTTIVNEFLYHWVFNAPYTVGVISLESDLGELTENLMGLQLGVKLANIPDEDKLKLYSSSDFKHAYNRLVCKDTGEDRYYILDHQGAVTDGSLFNKIEYMVKVLGCKIIVLDPLTLALSGEGNDGMDKFMSNLLRFVKREKIAHVNVVHVRKSQSGAKANSRGAEISEEDMKGSGSVFQVSMNNILLMRDKVHEDKRVRNTTKVIVSKNRRCGRTGPAGFWFYEEKSGRLLKGIDPAQFGDSELGFVSFEEELSEFEGIGVFDQDSDQSVKKDFVLPSNEPKGDASITDDWEVNENAGD